MCPTGWVRSGLLMVVLASAAVRAEGASSADAVRAKRFAGAFVGALVFSALPLGVATAEVATNPSFFALSPIGSVLMFSLPLLVSLGGLVGNRVSEGQGSYLAALAGSMFATLASVGVWRLATLVTQSRASAMLAGLISAMVLNASGTALALMWSDDNDQRLRATGLTDANPGARGWAVVGVMAATVVVGGGLTALVTAALAPVFFGGTSVVAAVLGGALVLAMPVIAWAVHKQLDGRGSLLSAYAGWLLTVGLTCVVGIPVLAAQASTFGSNPTTNALRTIDLYPLVGVATFGALLGPLFGLEWSHARALDDDAGRRLLPSSFGIAPTSSGVTVAAGWQW
ncbi:MAG: hypothetical protein JNG84_13730 [Archangium sp.]|nr:hypothetical protein [Archangium sp.]